jgi:hypothetical protein
LKIKLQRAQFVSIVWGRAHCAKPLPNSVNTIDYGWKMEDNMLVLEWFSGPIVPTSLTGSIDETVENSLEEEEEEEDQWSDSESDLESYN